MENFKKFRQKVKKIVNNSNYGAKVKAKKLAPIVRGWRNYHQFCKLDGPRFNLWSLNNKTWKVFNKESKLTRYQVNHLIDLAFPKIGWHENKFVMVKGDKSPFDGDILYWTKRNSALYDGITSNSSFIK
ncbi:group II intron maturase-specific domain-containing protein [Microcoleus sp. B3-D7]|uniref:group II intron maturase-specific domain-containing protein n=1 Tax=Microcoleus sp. B3-D7 TaxID=2818659 RepID=UPI002FD278DE